MENYVHCKNNSWLYDSYTTQWTLTANGTVDSYVFFVNTGGSIPSDESVGNNYALNKFGAKPTIYLKSNVKIVSGTGTNKDPYLLGN